MTPHKNPGYDRLKFYEFCDNNLDLSKCNIVKTTYPGGVINFSEVFDLMVEAGVFRAPFDPNEWMTVIDAAEALDCSDFDILNAVYFGKLEAETRGRQLWIRKASVREYAAAHPACDCGKTCQKCGRSGEGRA
jgi:hypothetical protein